MRDIMKRSWGILRVPTRNGPVFTYKDFDHTPDNKRHGEVKATGILTVEDYDGTKVNRDPWLTVELSETVHHDNGRSVRRVISVALDAAGRKALIDMLAERDR